MQPCNTQLSSASLLSVCRTAWNLIKTSNQCKIVWHIYTDVSEQPSASRIRIIYLDDGHIRFRQNSNTYLPDYVAAHTRKQLLYPQFILPQINNYPQFTQSQISSYHQSIPSQISNYAQFILAKQTITPS
jgi:hypothetical protein